MSCSEDNKVVDELRRRNITRSETMESYFGVLSHIL